jgi:hypothetical protein
MGPLRCARCGAVIGVYEPLVRIVDGIARKTSRAAEPDVAEGSAVCFHAACYDRDVTNALRPTAG